MSGPYPVPPPSYGASNSTPKRTPVDEFADQEPLLMGGPSAGGIYDQPGQSDLPDDFKVCVCDAEWRERMCS